MTPPFLFTCAEGVLAGLTLVGTAYHVASAAAAARFARTSVPVAKSVPPVSILKPIRGVDADAYENFASFCRQDYPSYEIVFGVQDAEDPAVQLVRRLQNDFPGTQIRLVISSHRIGPNLKVCNLHNILEEAAHELVLISDSDMRVRPGYLREIVSYFSDPGVGLVTSPYAGSGADTASAGLEALGIGTDFFPGVAVATQFGTTAFALGSTLALRKQTLERIGGTRGLAEYLADDFQIGCRVAGAGHRVVLSRYVVETILPNAGFWEMYTRRLRWMRTARVCQPAGFAGSIITHSTVWALLLLAVILINLALTGTVSAWAVAPLLLQQTVRWSTAYWNGVQVLGSRSVRRWLHLLLVSDVLNFLLWLGSWRNTVRWRGDNYRLTVGGRMVRVDEERQPPSGGRMGEVPPN